MSKSIARVFFGAAAVVPVVLCTAGVSAVAAPEDDKSWNKSNIAMNLGADKSGFYADAAGDTLTVRARSYSTSTGRSPTATR
ncbi:hypothetical protein [Leifsonia sp. EB34]|uniref:hypothetical protein n=1 Tax=Leifsonia sp. EB34 TaxID=3156303 RepID=UPI0035165C07